MDHLSELMFCGIVEELDLYRFMKRWKRNPAWAKRKRLFCSQENQRDKVSWWADRSPVTQKATPTFEHHFLNAEVLNNLSEGLDHSVVIIDCLGCLVGPLAVSWCRPAALLWILKFQNLSSLLSLRFINLIWLPSNQDLGTDLPLAYLVRSSLEWPWTTPPTEHGVHHELMQHLSEQLWSSQTHPHLRTSLL